MRLSQKRLKQILTESLRLKEPEFHLEKAGNRLVGDIISPTFRGKGDHKRQDMIWDALEAELGHDALLLVGMLLAYTPDEWHLGEDNAETAGKHRDKKVG
jgi:acid stress-induced BolA-like protein IbaG/YrbA